MSKQAYEGTVLAERGITEVIVDRVHELRSQKLSAATTLVAKSCLLDWCGVAIAGFHEPLVQSLIALAAEEGVGKGASVVGCESRFSARQAALLNGAMGHALDYDDTHPAAHCHVTASVLPAALAAAEITGASGESLLRAFIAGYEAAVMVGVFIGPQSYNAGFHCTGTVGTFGAAAAAAYLLQLDHAATARALGIAASQAAGLKAQLGTMCKSFHAGRANENGLLAAQMAQRGFTSRSNIIECAQGFSDTHRGAGNVEAASAAPRQEVHMADRMPKFHAACHGVHATIDVIKKLCQNHDIAGTQVSSVTLRVPPKLDKICNIAVPATGLEAKFSLRFNAALALAGYDTAALSTYTDAVVLRPELRNLAERVRVVLDPQITDGVTALVITSGDGRQFAAEGSAIDLAEAVSQRHERIERKFSALVVPRTGRAQASELAQLIGGLDTCGDIGRFVQALRSPIGDA